MPTTTKNKKKYFYDRQKSKKPNRMDNQKFSTKNDLIVFVAVAVLNRKNQSAESDFYCRSLVTYLQHVEVFKRNCY